MSGQLAKPVLRGHSARFITKHIILGMAVASVCALSMKFFYADPKKQRYADFYKTYDSDADFRRMRDLGVFQYARPEN